jgi:hypothetical protein
VLGGGFIRSTVAREATVRPGAADTLVAARG